MYIKAGWDAILIGAVVIISVVANAIRLPAPAEDRWRPVVVETESPPLDRPLLTQDAILWREGGNIRYQHLSGHPRYRYDWVTPEEWSLVETPNQTFVNWITTGSRLFTALISPTGEQLTAPIRVDVGITLDFQAVAGADGGQVVVWQDTEMLHLSLMDASGRPSTPIVLGVAVDDFAVQADANGQIYLAWRSDDEIFAAITTTDNPTLDSAQAIATLPAEGWLSNLLVLLTPQRFVVLWGITPPTRPDTEVYSGVLLPRSGQAEPQPFDLQLPDALPTRWARSYADGIGLAVLQDGTWQAARIRFGDNGPEGLRFVPGAAVDGSPPTVHDDTLAWVHFAPRPRFEVVSQVWGEARQNTTWQSAVRMGLEKSPFFVLWFIAPLLGWYFMKNERWVVLYWLSKTVFPLGMLSVFPVTLHAYRDYAPFVVGIVAWGGIAAVAWALAFIDHWAGIKFAVPLRYATFCLTDAILSFAIFGAAVESGTLI